MEIHNSLGPGFSEIVYKDALMYELEMSNIDFCREKEYVVKYKETFLPHRFYADFLVNDKIILEIKSVKKLDDIHSAQTINYLKVSNNRIALLVNFGEESLAYKRFIL